MKSLKDIAADQQTKSPAFFDDPDKDRLVALILELAEEICVLRDRVATAEQLSAEGKAVTTDAIDACVPDAEEQGRRLAAHQAYLEDVISRLLP